MKPRLYLHAALLFFAFSLPAGGVPFGDIDKALKDPTLPTDKKLVAITIFAKQHSKLSLKEKESICRFLLRLVCAPDPKEKNDVLQNALEKQRLRAFELIKSFNLFITTPDDASLLKRTLLSTDSEKQAKMTFYLLFYNNFYSEKLKTAILETALKSTSPRNASNLLNCVLSASIPQKHFKFKDESYFNREMSFAQKNSSALEQDTQTNDALVKLSFKNDEFTIYFLTHKHSLLSMAFDIMANAETKYPPIKQSKNMDLLVNAIMRNTSTNTINHLFDLLSHNDLAAPYIARKHWKSLHLLASKLKDHSIPDKFFEKILFGHKSDIESPSSLEHFASSTLLDPKCDIKTRYTAFAYLIGYNYYFENLNVPNDFIEKCFSMIRNKTDAPFIRNQALLLMNAWKEQDSKKTTQLSLLAKEISEYPELKNAFSLIMRDRKAKTKCRKMDSR